MYAFVMDFRDIFAAHFDIYQLCRLFALLCLINGFSPGLLGACNPAVVWRRPFSLQRRWFSVDSVISDLMYGGMDGSLSTEIFLRPMLR